MNLRSALLGCSSAQLARIAAAWALYVEAGTLRRELVDAVAARIVSETENEAVWRTFGETERQVLGLMLQAGGRHEADLLTRRLVRVGGSDGDEELARVVERAVASLVERGLLIRVYDAEEQRRGVYLVMADELLEAARPYLSPSSASSSLGAHTPPEQVALLSLAADLFALASALRREAWGNASRGLAGRRALTVGQIIGRLRQQQPVAGPGDPGRRWRFLLWAAQRAGWINRDPWPMPDDDAVARLLADPLGLPAAALAAGQVTEPGPARGGASEQRSARRRQAEALQLLSELDEGVWWSGTELASWLASELDLDDDAAGSTPARAWGNRMEQQFERWLAGRWFWLGLVAWGWDGSGWAVVSPTPALRALTTGRSEASRPAWSPCVVAGPLRLVAPAEADLATLYQAERYLAFSGSEGGTRRYGLTPASFERGLRIGGDADELGVLLARLLQGAVPNEWLQAIARWSSGSARVRLEARLLLSSDRAETLAEALSVGAAAEAVTEQPSPRHALVAGERVARLLADLAQAGLPVEIDPSLRVEPADHGRAAALSGGVAETAWVAMEVLRRLAPDVVAEQRDLQMARGRLEAVLAAGLLEALGRRAATIAAAISDRRRARGRRRVV